eukprot:gene247-4493_t
MKKEIFQKELIIQTWVLYNFGKYYGKEHNIEKKFFNVFDSKKEHLDSLKKNLDELDCMLEISETLHQNVEQNVKLLEFDLNKKDIVLPATSKNGKELPWTEYLFIRTKNKYGILVDIQKKEDWGKDQIPSILIGNEGFIDKQKITLYGHDTDEEIGYIEFHDLDKKSDGQKSDDSSTLGKYDFQPSSDDEVIENPQVLTKLIEISDVPANFTFEMIMQQFTKWSPISDKKIFFSLLWLDLLFVIILSMMHAAPNLSFTMSNTTLNFLSYKVRCYGGVLVSSIYLNTPKENVDYDEKTGTIILKKLVACSIPSPRQFWGEFTVN